MLYTGTVYPFAAKESGEGMTIAHGAEPLASTNALPRAAVEALLLHQPHVNCDSIIGMTKCCAPMHEMAGIVRMWMSAFVACEPECVLAPTVFDRADNAEQRQHGVRTRRH